MTDPTVDAIEELDNPIDAIGTDDEDAAIPLLEEPPFRIPRGKYAGITLPRMIGIKPSYYASVKALMDKITADPEFKRYASTISRTYAELRREAEQKVAELAELRLRLEAIKLLMVDQFEVEDQSAMTLGNGDKIQIWCEPHLIVLDKEKFRQWCLKNDLEREMVLPWTKANKLLKAMLKDGRPEPPGATCFARPKVTFSKGSK